MNVISGGRTLQNFRRNARGTMLPIIAASLIPLVGMAGGALDAGRLYLTKTRLQHACDAATLAGRRAMSGSTWTAANQTIADQYFHGNFTPGRYGTSNEAIAYTVGNDQVVHGVASAQVPMTMMQVLGTSTQTVTATCEAELQVPNSDIMFVLDTTLSMNAVNPGDSDSRIVGLRNAVMNFYSTMENARGATAQVRYGFVPYSSTVNVGALLKREWMVDSAKYQSRTFLDSTANSGTSWTAIDNWVTVSGSFTTSSTVTRDEACSAPPNDGYSRTTTYTSTGSGPPATRKATMTTKGITYTTSRNGSTGDCTITKYTYYDYVQTRNEQQVDNTGTTAFYSYDQVAYPQVTQLKGNDASGLMKGGSFNVTNLAKDNATTQITWNATTGMCIEERDTVATATPGVRPTRWNGSEPYDLDVDYLPDSESTRWRPALAKLVYARGVTNYYPVGGAKPSGWSIAPITRTSAGYVTPSSYTSDYAACPTYARKLMSKPGGLTQGILQAYVNALKPAGRTYHDIGFLWGLRLMSAQGLFASENATAPNGGSIARHLIFMTDGDTETNRADYDAYGLSALEPRRTLPANALPNDADQDTIVETRLSHLCSVAKDSKNITVWVIAFGSDATLSPMLTNCASPNRAYKADNSAQLNDTFAKIAAQISQLRLTK